MNSKEVREKFVQFYKKQGHAIIGSASIIPENDSSTLFNSSGMQPLVPYLMGEKHPLGVRLTNSQKSFRTEDIEEVGDNRHNTFFEMLGNWSLGDYFKKEQLPWFFEYLTKELEIDPKRLYVSVFRGSPDIGVDRDNESVGIWKEIFTKEGIEAKDVDFSERDGMQEGRIFYYPDKKNWWSRSGAPANMPIGEIGGPDSEVFYDLGADLKRHENSPWKDEVCHINCDCGRFIEIGNSVFIEYIRTEKGFEKLAQQNVDFGGGLERMTMVVQGMDNVFETDLFINIINKIEELSGKKYRENMKAFEIIADHLKGAVFIMGDNRGIAPSNVGQGYIVRRLIRRAIRYGRVLGITEEIWTPQIAKIIASDYGEIYSELTRNLDFVLKCLAEEQERFSRTIERGLKEFEKLHPENLISGRDAFNLYQTYGFPIEMTQELAEEKGLKVDMVSYGRESEKHQELSRTASAGMFKGGLADSSEATTKLHTAAHLLLAALRKVLGEHVVQKGSNITADRLRFDFSQSEKMTEEQKADVEKIVNNAIARNMQVGFEELSLEEAKTKGAMGVFDSKYGEIVKIYKISDGNDIFSMEICGGPHVENTGLLGKFKIAKEESVSAGIRRIKAILQ